MALKLPRTIRLDASDGFVYAPAAEPGEWAVTGSFRFVGVAPGELSGKALQAFRAGFLGVESFGWSTLVVVSEAAADEYGQVVGRLAEQLVRHCGAPDLEVARSAAEEEVAFAASLCDHPPDTLIALHRTIEADGVREAFRTLHRRADQLAPRGVFRIVEDDEEDAAEEVSLVDLLKAGRR
ncbi:DUF6505 family protein [Propylenella binzhouense]|uniref:Uncharacterized protein n=1 Tax=Propylenella binzhouense TaxID=2555902 RepID=A0A964T817_9HYPH|nr:DUF6505 family protein [Propylenella binzhouense]MYZ50258.1 hypothetical protein [Propylenella binzhouense]